VFGEANMMASLPASRAMTACPNLSQQPDLFSINPSEELAPAFQAAMFWVSAADFFKSRAVDSLNIRRAASRTRDLTTIQTITADKASAHVWSLGVEKYASQQKSKVAAGLLHK
jgi:hypothetical protein